ncbi:glycosyltransferase family 1 protein [Leucobacter sp. NPDC015123]|uniref:glycosyltransferase family 1 protein n=1 Tax=Leucobacter sp. NPDC015123 TaxID=3364129 RepID=UPI0036F47F54
MKPKVLILSFSPITNDARVLKQVELFKERYEVTTCGYGEPPSGVVEHFRIPDDRLAYDLYGRYITLRQYRAVYSRLGAVRWCREQLVPGSWDVVLANDVETVPLALELKPHAGVHADLHEYTPRMKEHNLAWAQKISPYFVWLCRKYVTKAASWTTVSMGLAREYERVFGITPEIVTNAAPYQNRPVRSVSEPIRLVHSGACLRDRNLLDMLEGVRRATRPVTLDLFLTKNDPSYHAEIVARAAEIPAVTVHEPVPYAALPDALAEYDVGVFVLKPINFNYEWALPNKLFDFVQARLGIVVGPSAEMSTIVREYGLGTVAGDFTPEGLAQEINELTPEKVLAWKRAADRAADELSAEHQVKEWALALERLLAGA